MLFGLRIFKTTEKIILLTCVVSQFAPFSRYSVSVTPLTLLLLLALQPTMGFSLLSDFIHRVLRNVLVFTGQGGQPCAQPPTWRIRVSLFVWVIALDLSGMGGDTINTYETKFNLNCV